MDAAAYAAILLGLLAGIVFAALTQWRWTVAVGLVAGAGLALFLARLASPVAIGLPAAVVAVGALFRPGWQRVAPATAGLVVGFAMILVQQQLLIDVEIPWLGLAITAIALILPMLSSRLAQRPEFAPAYIRDEALIFTGLFGSVVAAAPTIAAGWHSALSLNVVQPQLAPIPAWVFAIGGTSLALGGVYCLWRRVN